MRFFGERGSLRYFSEGWRVNEVEEREYGGEVMGRRGVRELLQDENEEMGIVRGSSRLQECRVMISTETRERESSTMTR